MIEKIYKLVSCKLNIENQLSPDGLRQPVPLGK